MVACVWQAAAGAARRSPRRATLLPALRHHVSKRLQLMMYGRVTDWGRVMQVGRLVASKAGVLRSKAASEAACSFFPQPFAPPSCLPRRRRKDQKVVYKRYASLYFVAGIDQGGCRRRGSSGAGGGALRRRPVARERRAAHLGAPCSTQHAAPSCPACR